MPTIPSIGKLAKKEFVDQIRRLVKVDGEPPSKRELESLFDMIDSDKSGALELEEARTYSYASTPYPHLSTALPAIPSLPSPASLPPDPSPPSPSPSFLPTPPLLPLALPPNPSPPFPFPSPSSRSSSRR